MSIDLQDLRDEVRRLEDTCQKMHMQRDIALDRAEKAEAELARVRDILRDLARRCDIDPCGCGECLDCEVEAALKETQC